MALHHYISFFTPGITAEDQCYQVLRRRLAEDPRAIPARVRHPVPGSALQLHLALQHVHETHFYWVLGVHHLVHAEAQGGEPDIRRGSRYLPRGVSRGAQHVARNANQPRVFVYRGAVDVFHLP